VALASRRDVREAQRGDGVPLARGRPGRRDPREFRDEEARQGCRAQLYEEGAEAPRIAGGDHDRRPALMRDNTGRPLVAAG